MAATKKSATSKATAKKKTAVKKKTVKKAAPRKKATAKKKAPAKKAVAKKSTPKKKAPAQKATPKKTAAGKAPVRAGGCQVAPHRRGELGHHFQTRKSGLRRAEHPSGVRQGQRVAPEECPWYGSRGKSVDFC